MTSGTGNPQQRLGSLFSGAAGLDMAVEEVLGTVTAWHCETDPAAARVLAHRFSDVPNLGDVTAVDWTQVEPVDVICGGSPCQDVSHAGKRAGMRAGTRSGLWAAMCDAIDVLRPSLVVWENVRGVLSAEADSAVEPCTGCVGDGSGGTVLRALGRVLGDLADLGYDTRWTGIRASDVGAPHGRFRVFVVATDAERGRRDGGTPDPRRGTLERTSTPRPGGCVAADTRGGESERRRGRELVGGPPPSTGDADSGQRERIRDTTFDSGTTAPHSGSGPFARPTTARDGLRIAAERGAGSAPDTESGGRPDEPIGGDPAGQHERAVTRTGRRDRAGHSPEGVHDMGRSPSVVAWGPYGPAIRRWEQRLGRIAPPPTEAGAKGGQRLSPAFVEWMMGWPAGWVTDVPGVSRNDALRICGNGVIPQQAAAAVRSLLRVQECAA